MRTLALIIAMLLACCAAASAQSCDGRAWATCALSDDKSVHRGEKRYRQDRRHRHREPERIIIREPTRVYAYEQRIDEKGHCLPPVTEIGTEHATEQGAFEAAKRMWQSRVRFLHGELYLDLERALHIEKRCSRSSTNETTAGRIAEGLAGATYMRCEIRAHPCRPSHERADPR